jgi:hypothetical protein
MHLSRYDAEYGAADTRFASDLLETDKMIRKD